jgi:alpha-2-macroglobulin
MRSFGSLLSLFVCLLTSTIAAAQERPFAHRGVAKDAARYEAYIRENWRPGGQSAADLRLSANQVLTTDARAASRGFAMAVAADDGNAENWIGLARSLLAIKADPNKGSERYDLPVNASGAAYRAYQLADTSDKKARALSVLGEAMRRRSYWRPAIDALKASLSLTEAAEVRAAYEKLRAEHGFRMTDYSTQAESSTPRACIHFSEALGRGQIDFSKYVSVDGRDPQAVTPEGKQLCIEGLAHGQRYEIKIRAGLPSDVDEPLAKPITMAVYVPDRKPSVRFTGKSYVLPSRGQQGIPVVTINTKKIEVEIYRVGDRNLSNALSGGNFERQLSGYELETLRERTGARVYKGKMDVTSKLNAEVTTAFPVGEAIGELKPGAYAMIARPTDKAQASWRGRATQWFIVSDLGLTAFTGNDGVHILVRSLAEANPVKSAKVRLIARNNEVLGTAKTDEKGYVRFDAGLTRGSGGSAPALIVAENDGGEYAFLDLTSNAFDLSDRGVKGREAPGPLDAFVYTERGVYRPGDDVNFTALVRDSAGTAANLPVTVIVVRPDGVEHGRYPLTNSELGGRELNLPLSGSSMTGTWRARLHADPKADALTQVSFLVEDFVPERLDMTLAEGDGTLSPGDTKIVKLSGRYLYGPPAADLSLEGEIIVKPSRKARETYAGYQFGRDDEKIVPVRQSLDNLPTTDKAGTANVAITLPSIPRTVRPLDAEIVLRLREPGGRTVQRKIVLPVDLKEPKIGIKPLFEKGKVGEGETASFDTVLLNTAGERKTGKLVWKLVRLDTSWQWYSRDGSWNYEAQTIARKISDGTVDAGATGPVSISAPVQYGRYRLEVASLEAGGPSSSIHFTAGWYTANDGAESPEMLDVALDKPSYKPGETAKLRIAAKRGGKALVAVLGSGLLSMQEVDLAKGGGDVEITVGNDWGPGAYATAMLYQPMDEKAKRMPSRAIGIQWIGVDQTARTLKVALSPEAKIKSGSTLTIPVKVGGLSAGEEARVTVAAVDVGILNLTRYKLPAPEYHFYAQHKLGLEIRDFYGRLIDGMRAERGSIRSGGDGSDSAGMEGTPPVEATVAFYSGIVTVAADGTANVEFELPDFNGTVRVMAVAWSKTKLGHGTTDVIVRDAVALIASAPRFLTLGDEASLDISLHNVDGPKGTYSAVLSDTTNESAVLAKRSLKFKTGERKSERVSIKPAAVGLHTYDVRVTGPGGVDVSRQLTFDVKPPAGDIKRTTVSQLSPKGGKLTLSSDLMAGLIASRSKVNISVGPAARLDVPGLLTALDRYPYGCAEQTVSRALPLVYANAVASKLGIARDTEIRGRVQGAIQRVFEMQNSSGAFGSWGPGHTNLWLTSYVTDFLTRAKEAGYAVRPIPFGLALDRLQNFATNGSDFKKGGEARAYALYVLARNGRAPIGELRYYADTRLERFSTPLAKAQIGAALAMLGDKERAERAFTAALASFEKKGGIPLARGDYGSSLRDGAALVTLASETRVSAVEAPRLVNVIGKAYLSRNYTSTQEQAWMLLAAHALGDQANQTKLAVGGTPVQGSVMRSLLASDLEQGLTVTNDGETATDAVVTVIGAALTPEPPVSKGFNVERSYYTLDGTPFDLRSVSGGDGEIAQNTRLVAVVKVESDEATGRLLLVDRLPAGLEIENPRLVHSSDVKSLSWLKTAVTPEHTEFRDDRFVAAFNLTGKGTSGNRANANAERSPPADGQQAEAAKTPAVTIMVAYVVRAITPGHFVHPAATIEDMYRPERYARTASGRLTVSRR